MSPSSFRFRNKFISFGALALPLVLAAVQAPILYAAETAPTRPGCLGQLLQLTRAEEATGTVAPPAASRLSAEARSAVQTGFVARISGEEILFPEITYLAQPGRPAREIAEEALGRPLAPDARMVMKSSRPGESAGGFRTVFVSESQGVAVKVYDPEKLKALSPDDVAKAIQFELGKIELLRRVGLKMAQVHENPAFLRRGVVVQEYVAGPTLAELLGRKPELYRHPKVLEFYDTLMEHELALFRGVLPHYGSARLGLQPAGTPTLSRILKTVIERRRARGAVLSAATEERYLRPEGGRSFFDWGLANIKVLTRENPESGAVEIVDLVGIDL